jgi:excisionase family DNA binding protein
MKQSRTASEPERGKPISALLTVNETATMLRCSPATIYRHANDGALPAVRVGGLIRIPIEALAPAGRENI